MTLPPLPHHGFLDDEIMVYTRQQIMDYGAACRAAALEEAILACRPHDDDDSMDAQCKRECADAIRALKDA